MESQYKIMKRFSHNLDQLLVNRKISVNKLAKEIMVSNTTVYKYLEGKSVPNLVALMHICEALDISPDTLLLHDIPDENIDLKFLSMALYNDNQLKISANIDKESLDAIVINTGIQLPYANSENYSYTGAMIIFEFDLYDKLLALLKVSNNVYDLLLNHFIVTIIPLYKDNSDNFEYMGNPIKDIDCVSRYYIKAFDYYLNNRSYMKAKVEGSLSYLYYEG